MTERPYASSECPYCGLPLDPLPRAKKQCPACRRSIYVRSGPDGIRYLLQEVDLPVLEQAWAEFREERMRTELAERNTRAAEILSASLRQYREDGIRVQILTDETSCAECRKFAGHIFDPRTVPLLPYERCRNEFCRCDNLPVVDCEALKEAFAPLEGEGVE